MTTQTASRPATQQDVETWVIAQVNTLGLPAENADSDFFAIGGTSLAAMRLIAAAEELYGEGSIPTDELYEDTSMRAIAGLILANAKA